MISFFADLAPSAAELMSFLLSAAAVILFAERAVALWQRVQKKPPMDEQLQGLSDVIQKQIKGLTDDCHAKFATKEELRSAQEYNAAKREEKTNQIFGIKGDIENIRGEMRDLVDAVGGVPHKVIVLLKDVKGLGL